MKILLKYGLYLCLLILWTQSANAQTPIKLQSAIDVALKNNLSIKNEKLKADYQKSLISTAKMLPSANISGEFGQINSIYADTRFGMGQSFSFPKVYESQKNLYNEHWKSSELNVKMTEQILKKQVTQTFYQLLYLQQKSQLLQYADSLYAAFYNRAELRLAKGESNVLEKVTAENQLGQIRVQLAQLKQDLEVQQLHFQFLLNSTTPFVPLESSFKMSVNYKADIESLKEHPTIKFLSQQQQIADAVIDVEKKKLMPTISLNYNNGSIRGTGADNKVYGGFYRFQTIQVGVGIPIFTVAQKAKINSEKVNKLIAESSYSVGLQSLNFDYRSAMIQYKKFQKTVEYFEKTALNNSTLIGTTAQQQLVNGSINYLEWVTLINQATAIRNEYIEAVKSLNESTILINYLVNY
nr:TolC family protein [uncultured Emticicia sp.]